MKKSFALLLAIVFVVVLGTVGALMAYFSSATLKQTGDDYLRAQEGLSAKSATEFAIQALQSRDFTTNGCINKIDINGSLFDVNMTFHYFLTTCPSDCNCTEINTTESNGTVMINTYVTSKTDPFIKNFRKKQQKP